VPSELPAPPVDGDRLRVLAIGNSDIGLSSSTMIWMFDSANSEWLETFRMPDAAKGDILGFMASRSGSTLLIASQDSRSTYPGDFQWELQTIDVRGRDPQGPAKFLVEKSRDGDLAADGTFLLILHNDGTIRLVDLRLRSSSICGAIRPADGIIIGAHHLYVRHEGRHGEAQIERWSLPELPTIEDLPNVAVISHSVDKGDGTQATETKDTRGTKAPALAPPKNVVVLFDRPSSKMVLMDIDHDTARIVDTRTGVAQPDFHPKNESDMLSGAVMAGGSKILYGTAYGDVQLIDAITGSETPIHHFVGVPDVTAVALATDGRTGAAGTEKGSLHIFPITDSAAAAGQTSDIATDSAISALALSSNGTRILVAHGRIAEVWDAADGGGQIGASVELASDVARIALDDRMQYAAAAMMDGDFQVWDVNSGAILGHWSAGTRVLWIGFAQDSRSLSVLTAAGKLATWPVHDPVESEEEARRLSLPPLTVQERARLQLP
jgi:WD40 repeat protein